MKVGTDGVLLGAWANVKESKRILDIGTGSGLVAIMLAQRSESDAKITAVEINKEAFEQATDNVLVSPWKHKIKVEHVTIQNFNAPLFDLIVCNPPYFNNSLKNPDKNKSQARHTIDLTYSDLMDATMRLLHRKGRLCVIIPYPEELHFVELASVANLYCTKKLLMKTRKSKPVERLLLEFGFNPTITEESELVLSDKEGQWTAHYTDLVSPFYLWA